MSAQLTLFDEDELKEYRAPVSVKFKPAELYHARQNEARNSFTPKAQQQIDLSPAPELKEILKLEPAEGLPAFKEYVKEVMKPAQPHAEAQQDLLNCIMRILADGRKWSAASLREVLLKKHCISISLEYLGYALEDLIGARVVTAQGPDFQAVPKPEPKPLPKPQAPPLVIPVFDPDPALVTTMPNGLAVAGEIMGAWGVDFTGKGAKARKEANARAIALSHRPGPYSGAEINTLKSYSGLGGIGVSKDQYYTPGTIRWFLWHVVRHFGITGGNILEPSCGNGAIMSAALNRYHFTGVELCPDAARIASRLFAEHEIVNSSFEAFACQALKDGRTFDAVVGNVPFGGRGGTIMQDPDLRRVPTHEQYFLRRSFDLIRPGGIVALLVPTSIIENDNCHTFRLGVLGQNGIDRAELLAAFRFSSDAFKKAGASVVTDLIVLRRATEPVKISADEQAFIAGKYFERRPERVVGEVGVGSRFGESRNTWRGGRTIVTGEVTQETLKPAFASLGLSEYGLPLNPAEEARKAKTTAAILAAINDPRHTPADIEDAAEGPPTPADDAASAPRSSTPENDEPPRPEPHGLDLKALILARLETQPCILYASGLKDELEHFEKTKIPSEDIHAALAELVTAGKLLHPGPRFKQGWEAPTAAPNPKAPPVQKPQDPLAAAERAAKIAGADVVALLEAQAAGKPATTLNSLRLIARSTVTAYVAAHGSPAKLRTRAGKSREIASLIAAFKEDGSLADMFEASTYHTTAEAPRAYTLGEIIALLVRESADGTFTLDQVQRRYRLLDTNGNLEHALNTDPALAYLGPGHYTTMTRYASGYIYDKRDALQAIYYSVPVTLRPKLQAQMKALKDAIRHTPLEQARVSLRDTWIPDSIKNEYLKFCDFHMADKNCWGTIAWVAEQGLYVEDLKTTKGKRLGKYLNHMGLGGLGFDKQLRIQQMAELEEDFREWLLNSRYKMDMEKEYNRRFNGYIKPEYSTEPLTIPGLNPDITPHGYQYQVVRKLIDQGRGINAHDVGLGKTLETIMLNLWLKANGYAKKPAIIVPKGVLANWYEEINKFTVGIRVLFVGETFKMVDGKLRAITQDTAQREIALKQCAQNEWDLVVMSDSTFQLVPLSPEILKDYAREDFYETTYGQKLTNYQEAKARDAHARRTALRAYLNLSDVTLFDDLGIDCISADEAHAYKNLEGSRQQARVRFLPSGEGAKRAYDFNSKCRYLLDRNGRRGVYLMTATPTKNNPLEVYNMLSHVAPEEWTRRGIHNLEQFIDQYGLIEQRTIQNAGGEFEDCQALVGFRNLNNLREIMFAYTDLRSAAEVGLKLPEPDSKILLSDLDAKQEAAYVDLRQRAVDLLNDEGEDDHIFSVIHEMEYVAFAPQLIDPLWPADYISPKMRQVCETVYAQLLASPGSGHIIFTTDKFIRAHELFKAELVRLGVPAARIAIINGTTCPKTSDRQRVANAFNAGQYDVLIGNDGLIGQGVNLQANTATVHHTCLPWTPSDMHQRNGRGVRQGNSRDVVGIFNYFAKGSFDSVRHAALIRKADWIGDLWRGKGDDYLNADADTHGGIDPGELHILLSPDPEAARAKWQVNKEIAERAHTDKKRVEVYRGYVRWSRDRVMMRKFEDNSVERQRLQLKNEKAYQMLLASPLFTHKRLLEGWKAEDVLISSDLNRVYVAGDRIKAQLVSNTGYRVTQYLRVDEVNASKRYLKLWRYHPTGSAQQNTVIWDLTQVYKANAEVVEPWADGEMIKYLYTEEAKVFAFPPNK